tara:strand:+ start:136 stop:1146 length:1011 start_codon:yes stop_codon:yes gene_type:complete
MSGWARSGNALTAAMLNANSNISFSVDVLKYVNFCFKRYPEVDKSNILIMLNEMQLRLKARFSIDLNVDHCLNLIGDNLSHSHIYKVLTSHVVDHDKNSLILGEAEIVAWRSIPYFLDNIKNSKAIIIVRDPRDVLVSFKKNTIATGNDYLISVFNSLSLMSAWVEYEKKYPERFLGIRFEELKSDPEYTVRKITDFLNIEYESEMLDHRNWKILAKNGWKSWENHDSSSFRDDDKLKKTPVNRWEGLIDPVDHFICELITGEMMELFNMELKFLNPSTTILEKAIERLMSSSLLKESFLKYIYKNQGSEKYPLDPCNPNNWDKKNTDNIDLLGLK